MTKIAAKELQKGQQFIAKPRYGETDSKVYTFTEKREWPGLNAAREVRYLGIDANGNKRYLYPSEQVELVTA